ncbi:hypothetical protein ACGF7W_39830 [Streptomyces sp. NPDC048219]|uniref:hypothetical protein n=1 Tax=Streptomyces sp. NPDC048219 TaxID=3365517 RepID=UPI00370F8A35
MTTPPNTATATRNTRRPAMALSLPGTRPGPRAATRQPAPGPPRLARAYADLPPTVHVALDALHLDALLGDPADPANPYGWPALHHRAHRTPPAPPAGALDAVRPARAHGADQHARLLRPLFRRDLALGHAWGPEPAGPAAGPAAGLQETAGLCAAAGSVLRLAARAVGALPPHGPAAAQWQPVLGAAFTDLLACETLTALALRAAAPHPAGAGDAPAGPGLADAAGYLVPLLAGEVLEDLRLVLGECAPPAGSTATRLLDKIGADRAAAGTTAAAACQTRLAGSLAHLTDPARHTPQPGTLFHLHDPAPLTLPAPADRHGAVAAALPAAAHPHPHHDNGGADPVTAALTRTARRLATEQRLLHQACTTPARPAAAGPADPAARALADRHALLLTAAAVLGVHEAAAQARLRFLGRPHWALLALTRITERLGTPLPGPLPDVHTGLFDELRTRTRRGVDCDVYATKALW